jgi:hypothetical protein
MSRDTSTPLTESEVEAENSTAIRMGHLKTAFQHVVHQPRLSEGQTTRSPQNRLKLKRLLTDRLQNDLHLKKAQVWNN